MNENPDVHRKLGIDLFNGVWDLLTKPDRSLEESELMIHMAHASRYHWSVVGEPVNFARGEWQISRVYSVLSRPEPARYHAARCLEICQQYGIGDFDIAFAYEALARAEAAAGNREESQKYILLAKSAGDLIAEKEDREVFFRDLASVPGYAAESMG